MPTYKKIKDTFSDDDIHKAIFGNAHDKKDLMDELKHKKIYGSALKSYKDRLYNSTKNLLVYINKKIKQYGLTTELYYNDRDNGPLKITLEDIKNIDIIADNGLFELYIAIKDGDDNIYSLIGHDADVYASSKYEDYINVSLVLYDDFACELNVNELNDYLSINKEDGIPFDNINELINYFITNKFGK